MSEAAAAAHPQHYAPNGATQELWANPAFVRPPEAQAKSSGDRFRDVTTQIKEGIRMRVAGQPRPRPERVPLGPHAQDGPLAVAAGLEAQARVERGASLFWNWMARRAVLAVACTPPPPGTWSPDAYWFPPGLPPLPESIKPRTKKIENRALGPQVRWAKERGYIEKTGLEVKTHQIKSHGRGVAEWRSNIAGRDFQEMLVETGLVHPPPEADEAAYWRLLDEQRRRQAGEPEPGEPEVDRSELPAHLTGDLRNF